MREHLRWAAAGRPARARRAGRAARPPAAAAGVGGGARRRHRHRRDVHRHGRVRPGDGPGRLAEDVVDAEHARARRSSTRSTRAASPAAERRDVHARHDGRHERADRADRVQGRVRDDEGLRGHAVHPADQPQGALRPALDASRSRSSRAGGSASGVDERLDADGDEVRPLDEARGARALPRASASEGAEAVARLACSSRTSTPSTRSA